MAARIPAQPAPTTRTSCFASTPQDATQARCVAAPLQAAQRDLARPCLRNPGFRPEPGRKLGETEGHQLADDVRESKQKSNGGGRSCAESRCEEGDKRRLAYAQPARREDDHEADQPRE